MTRQPTDRQLDDIRRTLKDATERITNNWAALARQTRDMQRGYPQQALGGGTNDIARPTERLALATLEGHTTDPATQAATTIARINAFVDEARRLDATIRNLVPGGPKCETCGTAGDLKQGRCATCYRRHHRHAG